MPKCSGLSWTWSASVCVWLCRTVFIVYLQMHTFERTGSLFLRWGNWCWNQHGGKSLQSAVCSEFEGSNIHYRYVCALWRPWTYIVFYKLYGIWYSDSRFITKHKGPLLDHNFSWYNSDHTFISFSLILLCIVFRGQIHRIIVIHILKDLESDPLCFPQSV